MKTLRNIIRREGGFTLTELAVAMLVVGILSGIAVPSFLGARNNAYDKEAQASIDSALVAAQTHYAQYGDFSDSQTATCSTTTQLAADLQKQDPTLDMVTSATVSTGPKVVSVQSGTTWNSNGESLGCQAFYATALSRSGTCWVARLTVEGKYLLTSSASPIVVNSDLNTANETITEPNLAALNGKAYAAFKPTNSSADGAAVAADTLANAALACSGAMQGTGVLLTTTNKVASTEFYSSWRSVVGAAAGSNI
ncbi:MAG: type II secretion system protein [Ilumatobacteraceae bacterium]|nr:type II secretion system protein [Ilumatobacteraceae bacterium]